MKRYTGQKALYEAISRSRAKAKRGNILERFLPDAVRPEKSPAPEEQPPVEPGPVPPATPQPEAKEPPRPPVEKEKPREPVVVRENAKLRRLTPVEKAEVLPEKPAAAAVKARLVGKVDRSMPPAGPVQVGWRLKPLQLNAGRVEVSVPYHIGVVIALAVTLVVLVGYRIGQKHPAGKTRTPAQTNAPLQGTKSNVVPETTVPKAPQPAPATVSAPGGGAAQPQRDNWIVVKYSKQKAELDSIKDFFEKNGIKLGVVSLAELRDLFAKRQLNAGVLPKGDGFLLVTSDLYSNPENPDSDGYKMKQTIAEIGRKYKPAAPKYLGDAYGMKISRVGQQEK